MIYETFIAVLNSEGITQSWTDVVATFSDEQLILFNFILESFPEDMMTLYNGIPNEDVISVLALIAYTFGQSRTIINNIKKSNSLIELYEMIENLELVDNNKALLYMLVDELRPSLFTEDMTIDEKQNIILNNKYSVIDGYSNIRNRGTLAAIEHIITAFLSSVSYSLDSYSISVDSSGKHSIELDLIPGIIDYSDSRGSSYFGIMKDSILYRQLTAIKPAGFEYDVTMLDLSGVPTVATPILAFISADYTNMQYTITIKNPSAISLTAYIGDYASDDIAGMPPAVTTTTVLSHETKTITRTANNGDFDIDGRITIISAYFMLDTIKSDPYATLEHTTDIPPLVALEFSSLNIFASKTTDILGGFVNISIRNQNSVDVLANITSTWSGSSPSNKTITIPANSRSTTQVYRNPIQDYNDITFSIYISADGFSNSATAVASVTDVYPSLLS
jgi:hypothetical protein